MSNFKKIDREFQLSDSTVNVYGYRLLTSGYLMDMYKKNPIGFYMHGTVPNYPRESGVVVKWEDLRMDGDIVLGKPVINLNHPRGQQTADEIEAGFLNAASMGKIVALEISTDPDLMLPDQTGPTITKWYNRECSLVDLPGNVNALAAELYDKDDKLINLADYSKTNITRMEKITLTAAQMQALNLSDNSDSGAFGKAFNDLMSKATKADQLETENTTLKNTNETLKTEKDKAVNDLADLKKSTESTQIESILAKGLADGKITKELGDKLKASCANNPAILKDLIDALPTYTPITSVIADKNKEKGLSDLADKSWSELHQAGKLEDLKASNFDLFKEKYKAQFNKDYKG